MKDRILQWLGLDTALTYAKARPFIYDMIEARLEIELTPLRARIAELEQSPAQAPASQPRDHEPETLKAEWDPHMGNG
jgi:hypothetical protein